MSNLSRRLSCPFLLAVYGIVGCSSVDLSREAAESVRTTRDARSVTDCRFLGGVRGHGHGMLALDALREETYRLGGNTLLVQSVTKIGQSPLLATEARGEAYFCEQDRPPDAQPPAPRSRAANQTAFLDAALPLPEPYGYSPQLIFSCHGGDFKIGIAAPEPSSPWVDVRFENTADVKVELERYSGPIDPKIAIMTFPQPDSLGTSLLRHTRFFVTLELERGRTTIEFPLSGLAQIIEPVVRQCPDPAIR